MSGEGNDRDKMAAQPPIVGRKRRGECGSGKVRYETSTDAATALEGVRQRREEYEPDHPNPEIRFYRCRCGGWHLTSRPRRPPEPGTQAARPWFGDTPELAGKLTREQRLERQLATVRWERDRWQRRYRHMSRRVSKLEQRRAWAERYVGFRAEYQVRGWWRFWKRQWHRLARTSLGEPSV